MSYICNPTYQTGMRRPFADFTAAREPLISCFIFEFAAAYSSASISDKTNESRVAKPWRLLGKRVPHLLEGVRSS